MRFDIEKRIRDINSREIPLKDRLQLIALELKDYLNADIYFCEIIGKRWSYVVGSGDILDEIHQLKISDKWGIMSDKNLALNKDMDIIINLIKEALID